MFALGVLRCVDYGFSFLSYICFVLFFFSGSLSLSFIFSFIFFLLHVFLWSLISLSLGIFEFSFAFCLSWFLMLYVMHQVDSGSCHVNNYVCFFWNSLRVVWFVDSSWSSVCVKFLAGQAEIQQSEFAFRVRYDIWIESFDATIIFLESPFPPPPPFSVGFHCHYPFFQCRIFEKFASRLSVAFFSRDSWNRRLFNSSWLRFIRALHFTSGHCCQGDSGWEFSFSIFFSLLMLKNSVWRCLYLDYEILWKFIFKSFLLSFISPWCFSVEIMVVQFSLFSSRFYFFCSLCSLNVRLAYFFFGRIFMFSIVFVFPICLFMPDWCSNRISFVDILSVLAASPTNFWI